jgi:1,6-anhydro-N-acetylmuramate kinase
MEGESAMNTSRNLVFLGAIALLLLLGAAVSVRSRASTSASAVDAPAAAALAASSLYQRSSQPYYVETGVQGLSNLELRRAK